MEGLVETSVERPIVQESFCEDPQPRRDKGPVGSRQTRDSFLCDLIDFIRRRGRSRCRSCSLTGGNFDRYMFLDEGAPLRHLLLAGLPSLPTRYCSISWTSYLYPSYMIIFIGIILASAVLPFMLFVFVNV